MASFFSGLKNFMTGHTPQYGSPAAMAAQKQALEQQEEQRQEQAAQRQAEQWDQQYHEFATQHGMLPIVNGQVQDPQPDGTTLLRPIQGQTVKHKDAAGDTVEYEYDPERDRALQIAMQQQLSRAGTMGVAQGNADARNLTAQPASSILANPAGVGLTPDFKITPQEGLSLAGKAVPATIGATSREKIAGENNQTREDVASQNNQTREDIATQNRNAAQSRLQQTLSWKDFDAQRALGEKDLASQRQTAIASGANPNLAPYQLRAFQSQYQPLQQRADQMRQQIDAVAPLLDETKTPDNQIFANPFTGTQMQMNPGVRAMLGSRAKLAMDNVDQLSDQIHQQMGVQPTSSQRPANAVQPQQQPQAGAQPQQPSQGALGPTFERQAQAIANYQEAPLSGGRPTSSRVMGRVMEINPQYQQSQYPIFQDTEKAFTTGKPAQAVNALNTMMGHLDVLDRAADALKNGNVQIMNKIANAVGAQTGSTARTTYDAIVHRVGPEVTAAYVGGGGSAGERGTNEEDFSSSLSPDQIHQNISISAALANSKIKALQDQYSRGTYGRGKQKLISDEAESTRQRLAGATSSLTGAAGAPIVQHSPSTGQYRYSVDGGKTWQPGQPPSQQTGRQ